MAVPNGLVKQAGGRGGERNYKPNHKKLGNKVVIYIFYSPKLILPSAGNFNIDAYSVCFQMIC